MKRILFLFNCVLFLFIFPSAVNASLLVVDKEGQIVWNVLSQKDSLALEIPKHSYIEVKVAAEDKPNTSSLVSLVKSNGKVNLIVTSGDEVRELDVSDWDEDLVEIEERPEVRKIVISLNDDVFILEQKGIKALTSFPISVDAKKAELSVSTPSGDKFLSVLPYQAVEILLRSKILSKVLNNEVKIVEQERELQYLVSGERLINLLDIFEYSVPVVSNVSASTGEILSIEAPIWYKVVAYLLT